MISFQPSNGFGEAILKVRIFQKRHCGLAGELSTLPIPATLDATRSRPRGTELPVQQKNVGECNNKIQDRRVEHGSTKVAIEFTNMQL